MKLTMDGQVIEVKTGDKNIIDVADRAKIGIPGACYHAHEAHGCCRACVVEIDGKHEFACATAPSDGMHIIVNRADLKIIREERLKKYQEGTKSGNPCGCHDSESSSCCE